VLTQAFFFFFFEILDLVYLVESVTSWSRTFMAMCPTCFLLSSEYRYRE